jgi:hypothetical protein
MRTISWYSDKHHRTVDVHWTCKVRATRGISWVGGWSSPAGLAFWVGIWLDVDRWPAQSTPPDATQRHLRWPLRPPRQQ